MIQQFHFWVFEEKITLIWKDMHPYVYSIIIYKDMEMDK